MLRKIKLFLDMIKFEHTVFALPFAYMGAVLGAVDLFGRLPTWAEAGWITLAMVGARSAAMGLNRLIDKPFDKLNPRTAGRALPAGLLKSAEVAVFVAVSLLLLFAAASQLHPIAFKLLPVAVFMLVFYSYTKRFTWTCHLILGLTIGLAPLGGWVAITGEFTLVSVIFYASIACWIAGFDIVYATQDVEFDRETGLHSIPSRFGVAGGLRIARGLHALTFAGLISLFFLTELGWFYLAGTLIAGMILYFQHALVTPRDLSRVQIAFFPMNGTLSVVVFAFAMLDVAVSQL